MLLCGNNKYNYIRIRIENMDNKKTVFTNPVVLTLAALLCCALWGSATPFIKIGSQLIIPHSGIPSTLLFAGVRFTLAGLFTIAIYSVARRKFIRPKAANIDKVVKLSAFQTVIQYIFFYIGLSNTTGVKSTLISGSNAFFAMLVATLVFREEKLTPKKLIGCILGLCGIVLVNINGLTFTMNFTGDCFVIFSCISYGVSSVLVKRFSKYEDPVILSGYQFFIGGLVLSVIGAMLGGSIRLCDFKSYAILVYLALLSAIAYSLWGVLLKYNSVSKVTVFSFTIPIFGTVLTKLMLSEQSNVSTVNMILALVLICAGIITLNYQKSIKQKTDDI